MSNVTMNNRHRSTKSELIACANCGNPVAPDAGKCPKCNYPWPRAQHKNYMSCPTCKSGMKVYQRRKYSRYNRWDTVSSCPSCGTPIYWFHRPADLTKERLTEYSPIQRLISLIVFIIIVIYFIYLKVR